LSPIRKSNQPRHQAECGIAKKAAHYSSQIASNSCDVPCSFQTFTIAKSASAIPPSSSILTSHRNNSSKGLARGGNKLQPHSHQLADFDEYELADYAEIGERKEKDTRELKREAKRNQKRNELEQADEMKFSHSIQFNAVPDWSSHYIAYSNLKKL
jgi:hypothetical protein